MADLGLVFDPAQVNLVEPQVMRDLLALRGTGRLLSVLPSSLDWLVQGCGCQVEKGGSEAKLYIIYKTGDAWPEIETPETAKVVKRDLVSPVLNQKLRADPGIPGYFQLKPLGRVGRNLTQYYLNKQAPRGKGVIDPAILMLWG